VSTRWFQALFAGKIVHFGALGSRNALADDAQSRVATERRRSSFTRRAG
jgi:hypothetical protein